MCLLTLFLYRFLGILINQQTNSSNTVKFVRLAVEKFNKELRSTNSTIIQLEPFIEVLNDTSPIHVVDARKYRFLFEIFI